jgi:hypothetical protein
VSVGQIAGRGRVMVGDASFEGVHYRIGLVRRNPRRHVVKGTIEIDPAVLSVLYDLGGGAFELAYGLGRFAFFVTDVIRGEIELIGPIKG